MSFIGFLRGNTAATIKLGPFLDSTDGNTDETVLTISQADVRLSKNSGNYAQKNESTSATHDELGMYDCLLDATDTNTYGRLNVIVHETGALTVDQDYIVLPEIVFDSFFPSAAGNPLPIFGIMDWGTAQASAAGTLVHRSGLNLPDDTLNGATEMIYGGTGIGQSRIAHDFANATDTSSVAPNWTTTPDGTSLYATMATPQANTSAPIVANMTQLGGSTQSADDLKDFADAGYDPATNKVQGVVLTDTVTTYTGNTPQTGDGFARLGAPAGASVSADIATKATPAQILTTALTEAYAADGAAGTLSQILFGLQAFLQERAVSGTTVTCKKLDGTTTAMTFTLNDGTSPTSITRAT